MTEQQEDFIIKIDRRYERQRKFLLTVIGGLLLALLVVVVANTRTSAANKEKVVSMVKDLNLIDTKVENIRKDYVDVFMFGKLCRSFEIELNVITQIKDGKLKTVQEARDMFTEIRNEILFDIKPSNTRSGGTHK